MTFSYDPTTSVGRIRLVINDSDVHRPIFSDEELTAFLSIEGNDVLRGAAMALETIASNEVMVSKVITLLDLTTNGAAVSAELRALAGVLRERSYVLDASETIDTAELVLDSFTYRERLVELALRGVT